MSKVFIKTVGMTTCSESKPNHYTVNGSGCVFIDNRSNFPITIEFKPFKGTMPPGDARTVYVKEGEFLWDEKSFI